MWHYAYSHSYPLLIAKQELSLTVPFLNLVKALVIPRIHMVFPRSLAIYLASWHQVLFQQLRRTESLTSQIALPMALFHSLSKQKITLGLLISPSVSKVPEISSNCLLVRGTAATTVRVVALGSISVTELDHGNTPLTAAAATPFGIGFDVTWGSYQ